ncbi:MAG: tetratricopeptide repeat protein [Acidobacteriota bacterium]|nr:tetratricopeptide repeat protein [Acidobacteriota bacterium]MDQ5872052.1 tetratricopeptide repeat protein [Acidobacteriota bacterium]
MTRSLRLLTSVARLPVFVLLFCAGALRAEAAVRERPLPPPAARAVYRSHWFDLLNALQENDAAAIPTALGAMTKAARAAGIARLSDFSRMAVHEARRAEAAGRTETAGGAYDAAVVLDDSSFDAAASQVGFLLRHGRISDGVARTPGAIGRIFASAESRLTFGSWLAILLALAVAAAALACLLGLFLRHFRRIFHDLQEVASRPFGHRAAKPIAVVLVALPLFLTLGPLWLLLYWSVLAFAYATHRERVVLALALLSLGILPILVDQLARENLIRRAPLYRAAVDLAERREDASVEDVLLGAATANPDDGDAWLLLGMYAERAGDHPRAVFAYGKAIEANPKENRAFVNRGNVRFAEGDFSAAIADYEEAARIAPDVAESFYNLSVARAEIYDFKGQEAARARALQVSSRDVDVWSSNPPLERVVPARYPVARARSRVRARMAETANLRGELASLVTSRWFLAPWGALFLAWGFGAMRARRGLASECARCGRPFCRLCKRYGGPAIYCGRCARIQGRKESVSKEARDEDRQETAARRRRRRGVVLAVTTFAPGVHRFLGEKPFVAAATLLLFFLALAIALGAPGVFELRPLAPQSAATVGRIAAAAGAFLLWAVALFGAWRQTRES